MLYPVYIHLGDESHAHGASFPDFPGCFTAADRLDDLPKYAQEAVETWFMGENKVLPKASAIEHWADNPDYQGGLWMLVDIDVSKLETKSVRINISLPNALLDEIDNYAKAQGATRSGFLAQAAQKAMR